MKILQHEEGFLKEQLFRISLICLGYVWRRVTARKLCSIIRFISPQFESELFMVRPCIRKLRYIGRGKDSTLASQPRNLFFVVGNVYVSKDFNGATYSFDAYDNGQRRIGCVYFERIT